MGRSRILTGRHEGRKYMKKAVVGANGVAVTRRKGEMAVCGGK